MNLARLRLPVAASAGLALFSLVTAASAAPSGHLDIANCGGGGVTVSATLIDFTQPVGGGNGCIITGSLTAVNYTSAGGASVLGPNVLGTILDLPFAPGPVIDFMRFSTNPIPVGGSVPAPATPGQALFDLHFDLTSLGPGVTNGTPCSAVFDPNAPACSAFVGSPFILAPTATGTSVTLSTFGVVRDASGTSNFIGAFTSQIAGQTPASIQATIAGGGSITSTNSGDFTLTVVPEPSTVSMAMLGGLFVAFFAARRKKSQA